MTKEQRVKRNQGGLGKKVKGMKEGMKEEGKKEEGMSIMEFEREIGGGEDMELDGLLNEEDVLGVVSGGVEGGNWEDIMVYTSRKNECISNGVSRLDERKRKSDNGGNLMQVYIKEVSRYRLLNFEEEKELSKRIQRGDQEALSELIQCNLRLVIKLASNFISKSYPFIDIIQDGNIGLIRAAQKFDHRKEVRFSTYAAQWIKQMIIRALSQKKRFIRLPYRKEKILRKLKKTSDEFFNQYKRHPKKEELADNLNIPLEEVKRIRFYEFPTTSLEASLNENSFSLEDLLDSECATPEKELVEKKLIEDTEEAIKSLFPKEKTILLNRFGMTTERKKQTLKDIANKFNVSAETIRQIENKALRKLKISHKHLKNYIYN